MPQKIEAIGTYLGTITESGLGLTKKSSFPQWVARLKVTKKYAESAGDVEHFTTQKLLQGKPGYVDYSAFDEEIVAFLVLFKSADKFDDETKLLNYEQVQIATGWDGTEFDSLTNGAVVGKEILFRVEQNNYTNPETGKTSDGLQVTWIDRADAPPERQLKSLDASAVKDLNAKLKMGPKKAVVAASAKPAAATKPGTKPAASPVAPQAAASVAQAVAPVVATPVQSASVPSEPVAPKPPAKKAKKTETMETAAATGNSPPAETNLADAWAYVCTHKGANEDQVVEEAWIAACGEVGGDKEQEQFTPQEWAKVRDTVLKDIAA